MYVGVEGTGDEEEDIEGNEGHGGMILNDSLESEFFSVPYLQ